MKLKVVNKFRDKYDERTLYPEGAIIDIEDEARVEDLLSRGLCEKVPAKKAPSKKTGTEPEEK